MALISFVDQAEQALATLEVEMRRMLDWLEHDRPAYWKRQIRHAVDDVNEAQAVLRHKLMFPIGDQQPSCRAERAALKRTQERLAYCQQKAEKIKHWVKVVRQEMFEYEGRISQLSRLVEVDGPYAIGVLDRIKHHIEEYEAVSKVQSGASYEALALADAVWRPPLPPGESRGEGESATLPHPNPLPKGEGTKEIRHPNLLPKGEETEHLSLPKVEGIGD
jgi:hypothetical protein